MAPAALDQRGSERHRLSVTRASVRRHRDEPRDAALHDISVYGCRLAIAANYGDGERLWLRFAGGLPLAATVVWSGDGFTGCRFDTPIARTVMRALVLDDK